MDASGPDAEPKPSSAAWAATPRAAAWRAAQPQTWPAVNYAGHLREQQNIPSSLIVLRPPPEGVIPKIEPLTAYGKASHDGGPGGPTIFLAIANTPDVRDLLVYVLRWEAVVWAPSGPPGRVGPALLSGRRLVLIDATTGSVVIEMLDGHAPEPGAASI